MPLLLAILIFLSCGVSAKTTVTYGSGEGHMPQDSYDYQLLVLAMEATRGEYGDYEIKTMPDNETPTYARLRVFAEDNSFENFVYVDSASNDIIEHLVGIPFPVDLGATGYRVGFVSPESKVKLNGIVSLEELKKISIIQGRGWLDGQILKALGFKVVEGGNIKGLFYMAANNRADIFLIGANQLEQEWRKHQDVKFLNYDESICIYYPLPKFYFMNSLSKAIANRIEKGLKNAYDSGAVSELWRKFYGEPIKFANLQKRKIFRFENPLINKVDRGYEKYILNPESM